MLLPILPVVDKLRMKWVFLLGVMQLQCTQRDVLCNIIMSRVARTVGIHSILNDICLPQKPIFFEYLIINSTGTQCSNNY